MSEQGKMKPCPFCGGRAQPWVTETGADVVHCLNLHCPLHGERMHHKLWNHRPLETAAETAATEYAQQAAELQEEMERLRNLWIEYRNATDEGSNYSLLAELFKRFDDAIRGTE